MGLWRFWRGQRGPTNPHLRSGDACFEGLIQVQGYVPGGPEYPVLVLVLAVLRRIVAARESRRGRWGDVVFAPIEASTSTQH